MNKKEKRAVVVTTEFKGVFFGYTEDKNGTEIVLHDARMAIKFASSIRGVVGLAAIGPDKNCKISYAAKSIYLINVTSIMECTQKAVENWEAAPWSN